VRPLFWRFFASFWLALLIAVGLSLLFMRLLNKEDWVIARHPGLQSLARDWAQTYEQQGTAAAQQLLQQQRQRHQVYTQVLDESGQPLMRGTFPPRAAALEARRGQAPLPWRRLTEEFQSAAGHTYLFIYRIPHHQLRSWQRDNLLWPAGALLIVLAVLSLFSTLLALFITRPLQQLRLAVHELGSTAYQKDTLARLAQRHDPFGLLARDFNQMGQRLQEQIASQRQLLRDLSHELRSPLARLRVALALSERAAADEREALSARLHLECDRLQQLIDEILNLARLDSDPGPARDIQLSGLLQQLCEQARLQVWETPLELECSADIQLQGWPVLLERALDNLLRNALRFSPDGQAVEIRAMQSHQHLLISIRDHGPGVPAEYLPRLGESFFRVPGQSACGYGLGLAIARRCAERHGGRLLLANHPQGGFIATLELPVAQPPQPVQG